MDKNKLIGWIAVGMAAILCVGVSSVVVRKIDGNDSASSGNSSSVTVTEQQKKPDPTWQYFNLETANVNDYAGTCHFSLSYAYFLDETDTVAFNDRICVVPGDFDPIGNDSFIDTFSMENSWRVRGGFFMHEVSYGFYLGDGIQNFDISAIGTSTFQCHTLRLPDSCKITPTTGSITAKKIRFSHGLSYSNFTWSAKSALNEVYIPDTFDDTDVTYWKAQLAGDTFANTSVTVYSSAAKAEKAQSVFNGTGLTVTIKPLTDAPNYLQ